MSELGVRIGCQMCMLEKAKLESIGASSQN